MVGPMSTQDLLAETGLEQSNLSRHVRELERAGFIAGERDGKEVHLHIADPTLREICELVCGSA